MFNKLIIAVVILFQYINGYPSELHQVANDVNGYLSPHIVGGEDAAVGSAKHMAALVVDSKVKTLTCGGSIVSERVILSAAHCIEPYVIWGKLSPYLIGAIGSNYWNLGTEIKFADHRIHPEWSWLTLRHDIGYLITVDKIQYGELIQPIAVNFDYVGGGVASKVMGWGLHGLDVVDESNALQELYVATISPEVCDIHMEVASNVSGWWIPPVDHESEICGFHSEGHGMCYGDSGSSMVKLETWEIIGIVSRGIPCARGFADVFVRVSFYKDFLNDVFEENVMPFNGTFH